MIKCLVMFLLMCGAASADTQITTERKMPIVIDGETVYVPQVLDIKDGDIVPYNSKWSGTIEDLDNVTFVGWNFSRPVPHTEVFVNCTNLKFIDGNLTNVELQADFTTDGTLTIHYEVKMVGQEKHRVVECGDNKTRTYKLTEEEVDVVKTEYPDLKKKDIDKIRGMYKKMGVKDIYTKKKEELINVKNTPNEKKIKANRLVGNK